LTRRAPLLYNPRRLAAVRVGEQADNIMKGSHMRFATILVLAVITASGAVAARAQQVVEIRKAEAQIVDSPLYQLTNTTVLGATASQRWLQIQTTFDITQEWIDELTFRYYVLVGDDQNRKILVGDVTHVNIPRKAGQVTFAYLHPNTLARYTRGQLPDRITVQVLYKERPLTQANARGEGTQRWWEAMVNTRGLILAPKDTPFSLLVLDRMPQTKTEGDR
jgi:hypothetical protein